MVRAMNAEAPLARRISYPLLVLYGLGTMVGAGIYALVGTVAAESGMATPWAFVVSGIVALVSAACFAELSARFPSSAGESRYVLEAFGWPRLSQAVGWLVVLTGLVSAATLAHAFTGFLLDMVALPGWLSTLGIVALLVAVGAWGIAESVWVAVLITLVEVGGLVFVLWRSRGVLATLPARWTELVPSGVDDGWGVAVGAFVAFYAYVGFEDMVNLAEEVQDVERTLPRAIFAAMGITTLLYVAISAAAVLGVDMQTLSQSATPMALMAGESSEGARLALGVVSILAGVNGALMQVVMASRVLYGMAGKGLAPAVLGRVHPRTRTPVVATVVVGVAIAVLALAFPLVTLAKATSAILLGVFLLVDVSMFVLVRRTPQVTGSPGMPAWLGLCGAALCGTFLMLQLASWWGG